MNLPLKYKIIRWTRQLRAWLAGNKEFEEKHRLFKLSPPLTPKQIAKRLRPLRYYYNELSTTYKGQIYTVRKILDHDHHLHLRFRKDGLVSGHYELRPDTHPLEHFFGEELGFVMRVERREILAALRGRTSKRL